MVYVCGVEKDHRTGRRRRYGPGRSFAL